MTRSLGTIGIVGTGLMGASLGLAVRRRQAARRVVGVDTDPGAREAARRIGALDEAGDGLDVLRDADVVLVAVPTR